MNPFNPKRGQTIRDDASSEVDQAFLAHLQISSIDAVASSNTGIHAAVNLGSAAQEITTGITNPAAPRNALVKGNVSGVAGNVEITGTNYAGEEITETIALNGASAVEGNKAFKTVTRIDLPIRTHTPIKQVETIAVTNGCTQDGVIQIIVTAAGMYNSPKTVNIVVTTTESTTALVAAKIREALAADEDVSSFFVIGGTEANVIITAIDYAANDNTMALTMVDAPDVGVTVGASENTTAGVSGVAQVETVAVTNAADIAGTLTVRVTSANIASSPIDVSVPIIGTKQVETVTVLGAIEAAGAGNAKAIVTAVEMNNTPKTVTFAVANNDTASQVAGKARTALGLDADVAAFFTIGGENAEIILTAKTAAANDETMSIVIDDDTSAGLSEATSENSVPGVAPDSINSVASKIRSALVADGDVNGAFSIGGSNANIILTSRSQLANDGTLAITLPDADSTGVTVGASGNTTAGVLPVNQVETIAITHASEGKGTLVFTITASGMGNSPKAVNVDVDTNDDTTSKVATKVRASLNADTDVSAFFTIGGIGANIILTAKAAAANDATMSIAMTDSPTTAVTIGASADTTAGVPIDTVSVGWGDKLGLPYMLTHNTVLATYLNNTLEGTAPTVVTDADEIEKNTIDLNSALNGTAVDIYLMV
jgi:hypothetical protein